MPLAVLSAIKEARISDISIKGGKSLEAVSEAQTVVFDKTGTLTYAQPKVARIVTFDGMEEKEALRISACLEEHFPHSMANAVVEEAKRRSIIHDEMHSKVKYVVAHGIASEIDGKPAVIGSRHFVFEDEHCKVSDDERGKLKLFRRSTRICIWRSTDVSRRSSAYRIRSKKRLRASSGSFMSSA